MARPYRLRFEWLEPREVPATFTVDSLADVTATDGKTSLREAVFAANTTPGADTIAFAPALNGGTIALTTTGLSITEDLTLLGPADGSIAIAGSFQVGQLPLDTLTIQTGATVGISGLRFTNSTPTGHGITNLGTLTLDRVTISDVTDGGGLLNSGNALVTRSLVSNNTTSAVFEAGGITNTASGKLTIRDSRIENNATTESAIGAGGGLAVLGGLVEITNVTIAGNRAAVGGGGVLVSGGQFAAGAGVVIENNSAPLGGGVVVLGLPPNGSTPRVPTATFTSVAIRGNTASSGGGLGIAAFDEIYTPSVSLTNIQVKNNSADTNSTDAITLGVTGTQRTLAVPRGIGGGLAITGGNVVVTGGDFSQNRATVGGGIATFLGSLNATGIRTGSNEAVSGAGLAAIGTSLGMTTVTLTGSTLADNLVPGNSDGDLTYQLPGVQTPSLPRGAGGGLLAANAQVAVGGGSLVRNGATSGGGAASVDSGTITFDAVAISENQATGRAGGLLVAGGAVTVSGSTLDASTASDGGGIAVSGGALTVTNSTLSGNVATASGGGLFVNGGTVSVRLATIAGNSSANGGGLAIPGGGLSLLNSIVAANGAKTSPDVTGAVSSRGGNLIGVADEGSRFDNSDRFGTLALPIDPRLGPLAENGGPTRTRLPATDSPALGLGLPDAPTVDQRGRSRDGGRIDAGAIERQANDPTSGFRPIVPRTFTVGSDAGRPGMVTVFNPDGSRRFQLSPFGTAFTGGVRGATADFNGDGIEDVVVGTGPGMVTRVIVYDGRTQAVLFDQQPFESRFTGGVFVTAGDVGGDGVPDLIVTPDQGGGPVVVLYADAKNETLRYFGIDDPNFRGGARAAVADYTGDGLGDIVVAAGFGGGPRLSVWDGTSREGNALARHPFGDLFVFEQTLRNGVYVAAGDLDGDGFAELIVGGGPGGGPRVLALSGQALIQSNGATAVPVANFFAGDPTNRGGVRIVVKNLDGDALGDLLVGLGQNSGGRASAYAGVGLNQTTTPILTVDSDVGDFDSVFVG